MCSDLFLYFTSSRPTLPVVTIIFIWHQQLAQQRIVTPTHIKLYRDVPLSLSFGYIWQYASLFNFSKANPFNQLAVTRSHHDFSKLLLSMFLTDINMEPSFCMVLSVRLIIRGCLCGGCWASGEPARQFRNSCRS